MGARIDERQTFRDIRTHSAPGMALGQKLTGAGALEVEAEGAHVLLSDGSQAIDFGSYALSLIGHRHPVVCQAVIEQMEALPTSTRVLANQVTPAFGRALVERLGDPRLSRAWLGLNGADAVEAVLKLARVSSGRTRVLALEGAFHGKSLGALALTWNQRYRAGLEPVLVGVTHIGFDLDDARRELAKGDVAAVVFEPIQGEGGVRVVPTEFLAGLCELARDAGAFVIADEIQVGLRRCGAFSLSLELELAPDAVLLGKALGGGVMPLSAAVTTDQLFAPMLNDPFFHSAAFAGHPLSSAAGLATLPVIEELAPAGEVVAADVGARIRQLRSVHPDLIAGSSGRGLAWGIEFCSVGAAGTVLAELGPAGLIVSPCLGKPDTLRLLPPMVTTPDQVDRAFQILDAACAEAGTFVREGSAG